MSAPTVGTPTVNTKLRVDVETAPGESVTGAAGSATGDTITQANHGLVNGDAVTFTTAPAGLTAGTTYYVRDAAPNTFKVSTTTTGAAADITTDGPAVYATTPEWTQIRGANSISPSVANTTQDATDYDSQGWGADAVTLRKWSLALVLGRKQYAEAYDPGQEVLRAAADDLELVHVRWYERGVSDGEAYEGYALVQWEPQGGTAEGLSTVNATLLGQGQRTPISNPAA